MTRVLEQDLTLSRKPASSNVMGRNSVNYMSVISVTIRSAVTAVGVLTSVVNGSSFAAETKSAKPPASKSLVEKPAPTLSTEQFAKIKRRLETFGKTRSISSKLTIALGATEGSVEMEIREISFDRDGYQHGFMQSRRFGDDRIIILFRTPEKSWMAFLTNTRFSLLSAAAWDAGELPKPLTREEATDAFANEIIYWATLSELL
jgi:hypothetical protein